jgi:proteasome activator subunit 4
MDLEGLISISTKDLSTVRNDIELALDTDFFSADLKFDVENYQDDDEGDEEDDEVKSSGIIGKVMPRSATVVSVNHWTNELKSCLKMKVDLPLKLRASLAKVYYYLALSTGQSVKDDLFVTMFIKLTAKYRELLRESNALILDHTSLLTFCKQFFPDPNPNYDIYLPLSSEADKETVSLYMRLASNANYFFVEESMREIYDWSLERFSLSTSPLSSAILTNCLPIIITEKESVLDFLPSIFHILSNNTLNKVIEINLTLLLGKIARQIYFKVLKNQVPVSVFKDFGVFTENQLNFILNKAQVNLRLEQKISGFQAVSEILVFSITSQNFERILDKISTLLSSLETFAHPSNVGPWTNLIAKFVHKLLSRYHYRYLKEEEEVEEDIDSVDINLKLTKEMNTKIVKIFKDIVLLGSLSKRDSASNYFVASIGVLSDLPSESRHELLNRILLDIYDSLTDQYIDSSHRLIVSLKQFTEIARFMISDNIYRVHVTNILSLVINKVGTNDLDLTNSAFNAIVTVVSFIQLYDFSSPDDYISFESNTLGFIQEHLYFIKENPTLEYHPDAEDLKKAFIASTRIFKDLIKTLIDKYTLLLEADLNEKLLFKFSQTLLILVESLSEDIFQYMVKVVKEKLQSDDLNNQSNNEALMANIVASVVKRSPKLATEFFSMLDKMIRYEIDQGDAGKTRNKTGKVLGGDKRLVLYLTITSEVLSVSSGEVLNFRKEYLDLISYLFETLTNPSLDGPATYIIHKTLKNLTNVKLKENRVFQTEPDPSDIEARWGLGQFSDDKFDPENLDFEWYIPSVNEISFAVEIFEVVVIKTLQNIDSLIYSGKLNDLTASDQLGKDLLYLSHTLSGASILFDPDFNSESLDDEYSRTSLQKKLMILKSLRESKSEDTELNIDIEEITKKDNDSAMSSEPSKESNDGDGALNFNNIRGPEDLDNPQAMDVDDDQSLSSRALTPTGPHESDLTSVMNPAIAFRESKLYNCNYFFGQTQEEKRKYSSYGHIHSLKTMIGHSLHRLAVELRESKENNVNLTQVLLLTIRTYFCDVGKESSFDVDDQLFVDYTFLKKVQSLANHSKPYTRTTLGARLEKFHRQRVILHTTNRFQSKLDKILLKDVVNFATSSFSAVNLPAQVVLIETMKKLIGSYGLVIAELLTRLEEFVKSNDFKKLESGLMILRLTKISKKLIHDYFNINRVVRILGDCLKLKDHDINSIAQNCFNDLCTSVQVPSAVVIFNEAQIDSALRPNDKFIDLEISTVKTAKDLKREKYTKKLSELQDLLISEEAKVGHWKLSLFYLKFVVNLQEYYEFPTNPDVIKVLIERAKTHHPSLVRLCIKAFSRLVSKILTFASYRHDLKNSFTIGYARDELLEVESNTENFTEKFENEVENFENPQYFVDGKLHSGYLFWGKKLLALKAGSVDLHLNSEDKECLKSIGALLTKDLLKKIFEVLAQENETSGNFQETEVSLISTTIKLIKLESANIEYHEVLELLSELYNKDEKAAVIIGAEIVCGLLQGTSFTSQENLQKRDVVLDDFFSKALFTELTPESTAVWSVIFWLLPNKIDFKRVPIVVKQIENLKSIVNVDSNLAFAQGSRIGFARSFLASVNYRYYNYQQFLDDIPFAHPYQLVRDQIGGLLSTLTYTFVKENHKNSTEFLESHKGNDLGSFLCSFPEAYSKKIIEIFEEIKAQNIKIENLSVQDSLKSDYYYLTSTILNWISDSVHGAYCLGITHFVKDYVSPFLIQLENNRELCKLGNLDPTSIYRRLASIPYRLEHIEDILSITTIEHTKIHQILMQLSFIEIFFSRNLLLLSSEQKNSILERIDKLLFHSSVEVRIRASSVLSGIIHNSQDLKPTKKFIERYNKILSKNKGTKNLTNEKIIKLHGSTLGIGALVSAFPYVSPPPKWLPSEVVLLAKASSMSGVVGKSAKDILSDFKKLRADTWHIDRTSFTELQLEDLEGVLWRSYFA